MGRYRQEVFNVILAQLLQDRGVVSAPENILSPKNLRSRRMPDVIVSFNGLRMIIEGEVSDKPNAHDAALESCKSRVEEGICHIGIAVIYPQSLRTVPFKKLTSELANCNLEISIYSSIGPTEFIKCTLNDLEGILRRLYDQLIIENVVDEAVEDINGGIGVLTKSIENKVGVIDRLAKTIGIKSSDFNAKKNPYSDKEKETIGQISGLILLNAMVFQEILADYEPTVDPIQRTLENQNILEGFSNHWNYIISEINYYPIFFVGYEIMMALTSNPDVSESVENLSVIARRTVNKRAALRHDLMGRIYHKLLLEAKYLGTYFTTIPAATILLKLAFNGRRDYQGWDDLKNLSKLRICDLACGTGTLLMAAAEAITDRYIFQCIKNDNEINIADLQKVLSEKVIYGYDVLPSAIHLTASTLSLRAPQISFKKMNLYSLPLGGSERNLGSIDFLVDSNIVIQGNLFGGEYVHQISGKEFKRAEAPLPSLDMCVINPPFTRSVGGNLLFGSLPDDERAVLQNKLGSIVRSGNVQANITAGLGAVFVAVADKYIKDGGCLALVLPKALLSGIAWKKTRDLINNKYVVEFIIISNDSNKWNFSESTDLSEVLLVARKKVPSDVNTYFTTIINLWHNPTTDFEALTIPTAIENRNSPVLNEGNGPLEIMMGAVKIGESIKVKWDYLKSSEDWMLPCSFAQFFLTKCAFTLQQGYLWIPGSGLKDKVSLIPLSDIADLGPDRRDIWDGFNASDNITPYPALWGRNNEMCEIEQDPNMFLMPLSEAREGRKLRDSELLWQKASRLCIAERIRLNTQSLFCVRLPQIVLSNVWWTIRLKGGFDSIENEKVLCLWLNSTISVINLLAHRVETEGSWICFKKPTLLNLKVIDINKLTSSHKSKLCKLYDEIALKTVDIIPRIRDDKLRKKIDDSFCEILNLPEISMLREMLSHEPVISSELMGR